MTSQSRIVIKRKWPSSVFQPGWWATAIILRKAALEWVFLIAGSEWTGANGI